MKHLKLTLALIACGFAGTAMATPSAYNLVNTQSSSTGGTGTSSGTSFNSAASSAYGTNGTDYGNSYGWSSAASGGSTSLSLSAYGTSTASTTSTIMKAWLGNYSQPGYGLGFGVTSQSAGELNASNAPDASSPTYQHAMDNYNAYEALLFSFGSSVTLNSISIGYSAANAGSTTDKNTSATVFEYIGSGDPTAALTSNSFASILCANNTTSTNCWRLVGDLFGMSQTTSVNAGSNALGGANYYSNVAATDSKYWMVGAYIAGIGPNQADTSYSAFKVNGVTATSAQTVPEPGSMALFGIAGAALVINRRRRKA